eukprot:1143045-Pelagomonas_calceolata.AAC.3
MGFHVKLFRNGRVSYLCCKTCTTTPEVPGAHRMVVTYHLKLRPMRYLDPNFIEASNEQTQA